MKIMKELENNIIELFQEMGRGQGINDTLLLTLFAKLYMEPEPIAMDDLAKDTGYSLASISNKIRVLGVPLQIKRIRKPGSKKIFLYMEKDILKIWEDALVKKEEYVVNRAKEKLPQIIKEYKDKVKTSKDKDKLKVIEGYYSQILQFEKILKRVMEEFNNIK